MKIYLIVTAVVALAFLVWMRRVENGDPIGEKKMSGKEVNKVIDKMMKDPRMKRIVVKGARKSKERRRGQRRAADFLQPAFVGATITPISKTGENQRIGKHLYRIGTPKLMGKKIVRVGQQLTKIV